LLESVCRAVLAGFKSGLTGRMACCAGLAMEQVGTPLPKQQSKSQYEFEMKPPLDPYPLDKLTSPVAEEGQQEGPPPPEASLSTATPGSDAPVSDEKLVEPQVSQSNPRRSTSTRLREDREAKTLDYTLLLGAERTLFSGQQMGWNVVFVGIGLMATSQDNKAPVFCGTASIIAGCMFIANSWFVHLWRLRCIANHEPASFRVSACWTFSVGFLLVLSVILELGFYLRTKAGDFGSDFDEGV